MRVLSDLWYGNIDPQGRTIPQKSEYKQFQKELIGFEEQFRGIFSPEQQELLEEYANAWIGMMSVSEEAAFVFGFRLGAKVMLEVLEDLPPT